MIVMSSSASTPFLHNDRKPSIYARAFAKELGANPEDTDENILDFLRSLPAKTIVEKTILFKDWDVTNPLPWKPNVDAYSSRPFLPKSFQELVQSGNFPKNIPILAGVNSEEGLILSAPFHKSPKRWNLLFQQWDTWAPQLFFNREADLVTESDRLCVAKIKDKYFNVAEDKKIPDCTDGNLRSLEQIFTTSIFHAPLARDLKLLVHEGVRVYSYLFSYQGSMTLVDIFRLPFMKMILNFSGRHMGAKLYQKKLGVCHGDDLFYLFPFNMSGFPNPLKTNSDRLTSSLMLSLWTNMAKFGNPNPLSQRDLGIIWEPLSPEGNELYLRIGSGLTLENDQALKSRVDHWNKLMEVNKFQTSSKKVPQIHAVIAEKRNLVMDPDQLFS